MLMVVSFLIRIPGFIEYLFCVLMMAVDFLLRVCYFRNAQINPKLKGDRSGGK